MTPKAKRSKPSPLPPLYSHEELTARLSAELPEGALRGFDGNGNADIVYAFQVERMNEVFGFGGWSSIPEILDKKQFQTNGGTTKWEVSVIVTLKIPRYGIVRRKPGACSMDVLDHALKGAVTSAEGKCFSTLGIAAAVYKGLHGGFNGQSNGKTAELSPNAMKNLYLVAVETGYKLCEKGHNIQKAMEIANEEWEQHK